MLTESLHHELIDLAFAVCDGAATDEQIERIEGLLAADPAARLLYLQCMELHFEMDRRMAGESRSRLPDESRSRLPDESRSRLPDGSRSRLPDGTEFKAEDAYLPSPFGRGADTSLPSPFGRGAGGEGCELNGTVQEPLVPASYSVLRTQYTPLSSLLPTTPLGSVAFSYTMSAVLVCIGLWIFSLMSASSPHDAVATNQSSTPQNPTQLNVPTPELEIKSIARITGMVDCRWVNENEAPFHNKIKLHDKFALKSGLMEITYHTGARVILQGPCTYEADSTAGGYLSLGKLTARVESRSRLPSGTEKRGRGEGKQQTSPRPRAPTEGWSGRGAGGEGSADSPEHSALTLALSQGERGPDTSPLPLPPSALFAIRTPTAIVTDLGTEFGVEVKNDETISHVFRGSVRLGSITADGQPARQSLVLGANESARVEKPLGNAPGVIVRQAAPAKNNQFVRRMINELDLLDIVAGGNGTGRRRERGIDPTTGFEDSVFVPDFRVGDDATYHKSLFNPLIDGVFIPHGGEAKVQLDSAGHTYPLPVTSHLSYGSIWSREAKITKPDEIIKDKRYWIYLFGHGEQFMPKGRGLLCMHANVGITFNLEAMWKMFKGTRPARFQSLVGMGNSRPTFPETVPMADVWVFVDGQLKVKHEKFQPSDRPFQVDVELAPDAQFLTLVTTDGGNGHSCDWGVFGDPIVKLDLKSEEPAEH